MVLSTPTPWTLPFISTSASCSSSPSSILPTPQHSATSALSPSCKTSRRLGSVLGLKSCSVSELPSSIAHLDLHIQSFHRRFNKAIVSDSPLNYPTNKTRSAGSFRLDESFCWINAEKELACYEGKPFCANPLYCTNASVVPSRAGRFSFEEKPIYEMPWFYSTDTHEALIAEVGRFNSEGEPVSAMPPSSAVMAWSTSIDTPAVPIGADTWNNEHKPASAKPFSVCIDTPAISAMPCSSYRRGASEALPNTACTFNVELEGDITAADVDLLPMPGLVNLGSLLYESYLSTVSPTNSRMTRISSSDYVSTANSSSNSAPKVAANYLGLPPEFLQEVDGKVTCCKVRVTREEEDLGCPIASIRGSSFCVEVLPVALGDFATSNSAITNSYPVVEDDNFAESHSMAGFGSIHDVMHWDTDTALHGSEGLASILTDLPQKQHAGVTQSGHGNIMDVESCLGSEYIMHHELDYLMMGRKADTSCVGVSDAIPNEVPVPEGVISASSEASGKGGHFVAGHCKLEMQVHSVGQPSATLITSPYPHFEGKGGSSSIIGTGPTESSQGSSIAAPRMPLLASARPNVGPQYFVNGNQSLCAASMPMSVEKNYIPHVPASMMIGKKRPFPVYDHLPPCLIPPSPGMFNPNIPHTLACQSNSMQQENLQECKAPEMSYSLATQAFSAMLYKAQEGAAQTRLNWAASQMNNSGEGIKMLPSSKARRRHGTAMDPQSIAARTRREKFSDRIRILQSLVPNGERLDTVSMLGQTLEYVRFLQHQVWQLYHGMDPSSNIKCEKWKDFLETTQPAST